MRFPKKNIAQRAFDKRKNFNPPPVGSTVPVVPANPKHIANNDNSHVLPPPAEHQIVRIEESEPDSRPCPGAAWVDKLYPSALWGMHRDMDMFTYERLTSEESAAVKQRLGMAWLDWKDDPENPKVPPPFSLLQAESDADKMLFEFVQNSIDSVGVEEYGSMLKEALTDNARIFLALRCYIASTSGNRKRDTIKVYRNKVMNSWDFFPKDCKRVGVDPKTGKSFTYYVDRPDAKEGDKNDLYWRSNNHEADGRHIVAKFIEPELTQKDQMPKDMASQMAEILSGYGVHVDSHEKAWKELNNRSRGSAIEDRIVARIAYLITNATVHKKIPRLGH